MLLARIRLLITLVCAASAALVAPSAGVAQPDSDTLFREAGQAFRFGDFAEALEKYQAAWSAGRDDALIHYNIGVTRYKLRQYHEALSPLHRASADPRLAPRAYYNLGLASRALGDKKSARGWFRRARDSTTDPKLQALATKALRTVTRIPRIQRARKPEDRIGDFSVVTVVRYGQDDNVYRSPPGPYVDLSQQGQPLVAPEVQSGDFALADFEIGYAFAGGIGTDYSLAYGLDGQFFLDPALSNADELRQTFTFDAETVFASLGGRRKAFDNTFYAVRHDETNFDPDDGADREIDGEDISERFTYSGIGFTGEYEHEIGRFGYGLNARAETRDYKEMETISEYDHDLYLLGAHGFFPAGQQRSIDLRYDYYTRDYSDRVAYDRNGDLFTSNPTLNYDYRALQASLRQRLGRKFLVRLDLRRTYRDDQFLAYNDYVMDAARLRLAARPLSRVRADLSVSYRTYDYPRAFAFNDPAGGALDVDYLTGNFVTKVRLSRAFVLWLEYAYNDVDSTDPRTVYSKSRTMLGVKWEH